MLLRMFVLLYDTEVVEEEAFLRWKEDVSEKHPGKGKALFQVRPQQLRRVLIDNSQIMKIPELQATHATRA